jgi:chemotaxis protein methyltransferase CheR
MFEETKTNRISGIFDSIVGLKNDDSNLAIDTANMKEETFEGLRKIIYDKFGIHFSSSKKYLLSTRLSKLLRERNINDFDKYLNILNSGASGFELRKIADTVTINETFFFRAKEQLDVLEKTIVRDIIESKAGFSKNIFKIWSAACSSGEESYTLAMIIKEKIQTQFPDVQFQIYGTDINSNVINKARAGVYHDYAMKDVPPQYMMKYFVKKGKEYHISEDIKKMVSFSMINLYDKEQMRLQKNFDLVICANVLIYFDINSKKTVLEHLYNSLNESGYLFVGYSESLFGVSDKFKMIHYPKAIVYKKI